MRFSRLTFPSRFRFTHAAGRGYRHYIEATWFGFPILRVNEWYLDGHARLELPFGVVANEPKVNLAANLSLWGESVWLPSIFVTDPRVRWEPIDETTARLVVPTYHAEDHFIVTFDKQTGLIRSLETLRYKAATDDAKTRWRLDLLGWKAFHEVRIPSVAAVTWLDEETPWLALDVKDVAYNIDVSEYLRASGP